MFGRDGKEGVPAPRALALCGCVCARWAGGCVNKLVWVPWLSWEEPRKTQRGGPAWCREAQFRIPGRVLLNALPGVAGRDFFFFFLGREKRTDVLVVRILAMLFCQIAKKKETM